MKTDEIIRKLRYRAEGETSTEETNALLTEAADRLEELDERVAIMSESKTGKWVRHYSRRKDMPPRLVEQMDEAERRDYLVWLEITKDHEIMRKCREGKVKKYVGRGVVVLNYQWWRELLMKTGFRAVPTDEDMEGAEHDRREGETDRAD